MDPNMMVAQCMVLTIISSLSAGTQAQLTGDVIPLVEQGASCVADGDVTLICPENYMVVLRSAQYFQSLEPGCNTESTSICEVADVRFTWFSGCIFNNECEISLETSFPSNTCTGYKGEPFLRYSYRCEQPIEQAHAQNKREMCDMDTVWQGSHLFLINANYPRYNQNTDCGCAVYTHAHTQLEITLAQFEAANENETECDQSFRLQSGSKEQTICSEKHKEDFKPLDMTYEHEVFFKIENYQAEEFKFIVVLQTHHNENFTVKCTRDYVLPARLTTTTHRTMFDSTDHSESEPSGIPEAHQAAEHNNMELHWPIITGVVGFICVTLVISIVILIFCKRQSKQKRGSTNKLAFDNNVYLSPNEASTPKNQTIINMNNIDKVHTPKHKRVTSSSQRRHTTESREKINPKRDESNIEEMGFQIETSLPHDSRGSIIATSLPVNTLLPVTAPLSCDVDGKTINELKNVYPDIPEGILKELRCQSEATIAITHPYTTKQPHAFDNTSVKSNLSALRSDKGTTVITTVKTKPKDNETKKSLLSSTSDPSDGAEVVCESVDVTPYSSMSDLSVKDKAKLMTQQLKLASN